MNSTSEAVGMKVLCFLRLLDKKLLVLKIEAWVPYQCLTSLHQCGPSEATTIGDFCNANKVLEPQT